jgi:hypothetical protein
MSRGPAVRQSTSNRPVFGQDRCPENGSMYVSDDLTSGSSGRETLIRLTLLTMLVPKPENWSA